MINQDFGQVYDSWTLDDITTEGKLLGKNVPTPTKYDPDILVKVERSITRDINKINIDNFTSGDDVWRCYECSTLTKNGMPVYFIMFIKYPYNSQYLVESKSLKLYLNSFNMERSTTADTQETIKEYLKKVSDDLSRLLDTDVKAWTDANIKKFDDYENIEKLIDYSQVIPSNVPVNAQSLQISPIHSSKRLQIAFEGFRSNCKITNAPDYATVYINFYSKKGIDLVSLAKYLLSYRAEQHLHEECCEMIFNDLFSVYEPIFLDVTCSYTRRGGIDITPTRKFHGEIKKHGFVLSGTTSTISDSYNWEPIPARTIYQ